MRWLVVVEPARNRRGAAGPAAVRKLVQLLALRTAETEGGASALAEPAQTVGRDAALAGFASRLEAFQGWCHAGGTAGDCASALLRLDTELLQLIDSARVPQERALGWKAALLEIQFLAESERYAAMNRWFEQIPSTKWPALQVGHSQ